MLKGTDGDTLPPIFPGPRRSSLSHPVVFLVSVGTFLLLREGLGAWGVAGVAVAEWTALLALPGFLLGSRPGGVARAVGLRPLRLRGAGGAVLLGAAGLPVAWGVYWLQSLFIPADPRVVEALGRELVPEGAAAFTLLALLAALTPAVCEEFTFRGVLLNGLRGRLVGGWAVAGSALLFGLLHWSPGGAFRVLPTAAVGVLLGWAAWRARSLVAAVILHLTHNLLILTATAAAAWRGVAPPPDRLPGPPPFAVLVGGVALIALGSQLLAPPSFVPEPHEIRDDPHVR